LIMRIKTAGRNATLVLLNAKANSARLMDALNIRRMISGDDEPKVMRASNNGRKKAPAGKPRHRRAA
ncbi:peptidase S11, partial [Pseudoduganella sp. RAF53_2]